MSLPQHGHYRCQLGCRLHVCWQIIYTNKVLQHYITLLCHGEIGSRSKDCLLEVKINRKFQTVTDKRFQDVSTYYISDLTGTLG